MFPDRKGEERVSEKSITEVVDGDERVIIRSLAKETRFDVASDRCDTEGEPETEEDVGDDDEERADREEDQDLIVPGKDLEFGTTEERQDRRESCVKHPFAIDVDQEVVDVWMFDELLFQDVVDLLRLLLCDWLGITRDELVDGHEVLDQNALDLRGRDVTRDTLGRAHELSPSRTHEREELFVEKGVCNLRVFFISDEDAPVSIRRDDESSNTVEGVANVKTLCVSGTGLAQPRRGFRGLSVRAEGKDSRSGLIRGTRGRRRREDKEISDDAEEGKDNGQLEEKTKRVVGARWALFDGPKIRSLPTSRRWDFPSVHVTACEIELWVSHRLVLVNLQWLSFLELLLD